MPRVRAPGADFAIGAGGATTSLVIVRVAPTNGDCPGTVNVGVAVSVPSTRPLTSIGAVVNDPPDGTTSGNVTLLPFVSLTTTDTFVASGCGDAADGQRACRRSTR